MIATLYRNQLRIAAIVVCSVLAFSSKGQQQTERDSLWLNSVRHFFSSPTNSSLFSDSLLTDKTGFISDKLLATKNVSSFKKMLPEDGRNNKTDILRFEGGFLQYSLNYRSAIDTPFAEKNIAQHLLTANANVLIGGTLPFTIIYSGRQSNSALFRDFNEIQVK